MFSVVVKPYCMMPAPDNCTFASLGLMATPMSATLMSLVTVNWPVSMSTSTSAPLAPTPQKGVAMRDWPVSESGFS